MVWNILGFTHVYFIGRIVDISILEMHKYKNSAIHPICFNVIHNSKYWHWSYRFVEVRRYKRTELKGLHEEARGNVTTHKGETIVRDYSTINKEEQNWTFLIDMSSKNGANAIKTSLPPSTTSTQMHVLPFPKSASASELAE